MEQIKKRDIALDIMKGLGMLFVIRDHSELIPLEYRHVTMSCMMPMFFVLAGYLYHRPDSNWLYVKKSFARLYLPYLLGVAIFVVFLWWHNWTDVRTAGLMIVGCAGVPHFVCRYWCDWPSVGAFWFFPALFWCRVVFNAIYTHCGKAKYYVLIATAIVGYLSLRYLIHLPFGISEGLAVMMFYLSGHLFSKYKSYMSTMSDDRRSRLNILNEIALVLCLICWVIAAKHSDIVVSAAYYKMFFFDFFGALGIIYVYYLACRYIATNLKILKSVLVWFGVGSLFLLWIHRTELTLNFVNKLLGVVDWTAFNQWAASAGMPELYAYIHLLVQYAFCSVCLYAVSKVPPFKKFFGIA